MFLQPMGMPGLLQPPGSADPIQRLALMMALTVLGIPPVYSCHTSFFLINLFGLRAAPQGI
jgi:hypothetical protein